MPNRIIIGTQWGDEGKGKAIDVFAGDADVVVRYQGGGNAGHSLKIGNQEYVLHLVPSGIVRARDGVISVMGNNEVIAPGKLIEEINHLKEQGLWVTPDSLVISDGAVMTLLYHRVMDGLKGGGIGTTRRGIGPSYEDKADRDRCVRFFELRDMGALEKKVAENTQFYNHMLGYYTAKLIDFKDVWQEVLETRDQILPFVRDDVIDLLLKHNGKLLFEGAQGTLLDVDHGTTPFTTSSNTTIGGAYTGAGVYINFDQRTGIFKAYTTRVGEGPFPTELAPEKDVKATYPSKEELKALGKNFQQWETERYDRAATLRAIKEDDKMATSRFFRIEGGEFGATTGRPRRCGWPDWFIGLYAKKVNGLTDISLTKLDVMDHLDAIKVCVGYKIDGKTARYFPVRQLAQCQPIYQELPGWKADTTQVRRYADLPKNAKNYVEQLEGYLGIPVSSIGVGKDREQTIIRQHGRKRN